MIIKKIFAFFSEYHHRSISNYSKNLDFDIMIDIGAHEGEFLSSFLKIKKIKKYYCFEPQIKIFKRLKKRYKDNNKIKFFNFPLGDKPKKKKLFLSKLTSTATLSSFNKVSLYLKFKNFILNNQNQQSVIVKQKTFDQIFKKTNIKKSFLKIDVEGYELNVLKGSKKKIKKVKYILIEDQYFNQYKNDFNKVKKFLKKNNFEILKTFNFPTLHYRDILFKKNPQKFLSEGF